MQAPAPAPQEQMSRLLATINLPGVSSTNASTGSGVLAAVNATLARAGITASNISIVSIKVNHHFAL